MCRTQCYSSAARGKWRATQLLFLLLWFGKTSGILTLPAQLNEPPLITHHTQSYTAFQTDDVFLQCDASGNPTPFIRWVKDDKLIQNSTSGNFTADENEELKFYQGKYRCYASNILGTAESDLIELITEPIPVTLKDKKVVLKANKGDSVVLQCNVPNSSVKANIHWMDKKLMHIRQSDRITIGLNGNLYFANVLESNTRTDYTCHIQYFEARTILATEPVSLIVKASNELLNKAPGLHQPEGTHTSYSVLRGQTVILECIPYGLPTPTVHWERKDAPLSSSLATMERFDRWLEFANIAESDSGEYTCTASNIMGNITHSYTVHVEAAPYWKKTPDSDLYSPGETIKLDCQAHGIPTPVITWKINGMLISETDFQPRRSVVGGTLILRDVQTTDTAVYQCEASNVHGTIVFNSYTHIIELPPMILTDDKKEYKFVEKFTAFIHCKTFGSPRPTIIWKSGEDELVMSNPRTSQLTNGTIVITDLRQEDAGTYFCSVNNNLSISAQLVVLNKTRIVSPLTDRRMLRGTSLNWTCEYKVDPRHIDLPTILWRKNGQKLLSSSSNYSLQSSSLKINDISAENAGLYTCEVITTLDYDKTSGSLTVIDKPEAPHSLKLAEKANRSVTLSWSPGYDNNSPVSEFVLEMKEDLHSETGNWKKLKLVPVESRHHEISLLPFCTYRFRLAAVNEIGTSAFSLPSEPYTTPPAAPDMNPENVRSESTNPESMIITWKELEPKQFNGPDFGYKVFWRDEGDPEGQWQSEFVSRPPFIVNNTRTFAPFEIKVQAANGLGKGPSPEAAIGYSGEEKPLKAPSGISVDLMNKTTAFIVWEAVSRESVRGHLLGYKIRLSKLGSREVHFHRGKEKRSLAMEREMVQDMEGVSEKEEQEIVVEGKEKAIVEGLDFYSIYKLSIAAFNSKGDGPWSSPTNFSTDEGAPGPVSHLRFESPSETELILFWKKPHKTNGILKGYEIMCQQIEENGRIILWKGRIVNSSMTHYNVPDLDSNNYYSFYLRAFTDAGRGEFIHINATTLLDGVPPVSVNTSSGETFVNLSWVPGERQRNIELTLRVYLEKSTMWEHSEQMNSTQGFHQLQGLKAGTSYRLEIYHDNSTYWLSKVETTGPDLAKVHNDFATQGWFIGLISAIVLLLLLLLILCFVKKSKGGKYSVKDKEEGQLDSDAKPMKDEGFGEYSSDNDEKRSFSQRSLCPELKRESDDSLGEYGDSVDIQFNEDGSFIGQYSGRRDTQPYTHGEQESSGVPSPNNPNMHPPTSGSFHSSVTGILGGN